MTIPIKQNMEEFIHRTLMSQFSAEVNRGHNSRMDKVVKSKIKLFLPSIVPDLMYKFQMICL